VKIHRRRFAAALLACLVVALPAARADNPFFFGKPPDEVPSPRHALVVGIGQYARLRDLGPNPANDARAVHDMLGKFNFGSTLVLDGDADHEGLVRKLNALEAEVQQKGGLLLFYFAGHGVTIRGKGYIAPVGADLGRPEDAEFFLPVDRIYETIRRSQARAALVILDSCRTDPFKGRAIGDTTTGVGVGDPPSRTYVAFAAGDGGAASNGATNHSPFTDAFLKVVEGKPDLPVPLLFNEVMTLLVDPRINQETLSRDHLPGRVALLTTEHFYQEEKAAFDKAGQLPSYLSYQSFMNAWPVGYFYAKARQLAAQLGQSEGINKTGTVGINKIGTLTWPTFATQAITKKQVFVFPWDDPTASPVKPGEIASGAPVVVTGQVGPFAHVTAPGVDGFVPWGDIQIARPNSVEIALDPKTLKPSATRLRQAVGRVAGQSPAGVVVQVNIPEAYGSGAMPIALDTSFDAALAIAAAGVDRKKIVVASTTRGGTAPALTIIPQSSVKVTPETKSDPTDWANDADIWVKSFTPTQQPLSEKKPWEVFWSAAPKDKQPAWDFWRNLVDPNEKHPL
jgi:hypothetical protein